MTTKVAVNALLGDTPALADYGTAIMHNLGTREVTAVVCIKYSTILLTYFNLHLPCTVVIGFSGMTIAFF